MEDRNSYDDYFYVPLTRYEIIEDERYNARFAEMFRDELSDQQIMVILHYLLRPIPDCWAAGAVLREYISPVMIRVVESIKEEHRSANTGVSRDHQDD